MLYTHAFTGIGTHWHISVDHTTEPKDLWCLIDDCVKDFENRFSRFKPDTLVNKFKTAEPGAYRVDPEFAFLLSFAQKIKKHSGGRFDPAVSELLSLKGYDPSYSFKADNNKIEGWQTPAWSIKDDLLKIDGPISFDIGGFGKGYLIDKIAQLIKKNGYQYFLVDGGGDMFGSSKSDNEGWKIAIENPEDNSISIGVIALNNMGLAVSDIFKRRWHGSHHIVDPITKSSSDSILSCAIISKTAINSDALTTAFMLSPRSSWKKLATEFDCHYMIIEQDHKITVDVGWPGSFL